jgi:hypothetical protein
MGVKGNYSAKQVFLRCSLLQFFQQVAMPGMDTIKHAYGKQCFPLWSYTG